MRGTTLKGMLLYEASVKPHIKKLVDEIDQLSLEDIETIEVPLPWFRQALREMKANHASKEQEERILANIVTGENEEEEGFMVQWNESEPIFVKVSKAYLEVTHGTPILLLQGGGMWVGSTYCVETDFRLLVISPKKKMARGEYVDYYQKRLNHLHGGLI